MHEGKNLGLVAGFSVVLLVLLALYLRLHVVLHTDVISPTQADAADYYSYAYNLRHTGVYSRTKPRGQPYSPEELVADSVRSPGYPLLLAPFVSGMPNRTIVTNIIVTQALISTLSVLLAYGLYRLFLPAPWALTAGLLTALSPHLATMSTYLLSETLFTFWLLLSLWLFTLPGKQAAGLRVFLAGLALGAATLTRPGLQYFFVPMLVLSFYYRAPGERTRVMAALALGFLLVVGPWHIRNLVSTGDMSDQGLMVNFLHHGMYPDFQYEGDVESTGFPYRYDPESATISQDIPSVLLEIAQRTAEEPGRYLHWYLLGKPVTFWSWGVIQGAGDVFVYDVRSSPYFDEPAFGFVHRFMYGIHDLAVVMALLATVLVWLPRWAATSDSTVLLASRCTSLLLLYYTGLHIVGAPFPRYSIPLQPVLYGMAVLFLYMLLQWWRGRGSVVNSPVI